MDCTLKKINIIFLFLIISLMSACFSPIFIEEEADSPTGQTTDYLYKITWSDGDIPGYSISIFYSLENDILKASPIVSDIPGEEPENEFYWNTAGISDGEYFIFVTQENGNQNSLLDTIGPVRISHSSSCIDVSSRVNLLPNNGFENGKGILTEGDAIVGWRFNNSERNAEIEWVSDSSQVYMGNRSMMLEKTFNGVNSTSAWLDRIVVKSQKIDLPTPGGKYLFTAWIRVEDVEPGHVLFEFNYFDRNGEELKIDGHNDDTFYVELYGTTDWTRIIYLLNVPHWNSPPYSEYARAEKIEVAFSLDHSPGRLWVDEISLFEISNNDYERFFPGNHFQAPEIVTTDSPLTLPKKEGWATSIQQDPNTGIWWIVSPEQKAFWGLGVNVGPNEKIEAISGLDFAQYRNYAQFQAHTDLNFNVGWRQLEGPDEYSSTQNFIYWMNFSSAPSLEAAPDEWVLKDRHGNLIGNFGHYFPDVFSPVWQNFARLEAQTITKEGGWILDRERVMGYWTDNEFSYGDLYDFIWGETAKLAFMDWLQGKNDLPSVDEAFINAGIAINLNVPEGFEIMTPYKSIDQLNESWSSTFHNYAYSSFDEIYKIDKPYIRSHGDPVKPDLYAFERVIYKIYVDTIVDNIRKVETEYIAKEGHGYHKPIFSNRFHLKSPAALLALKRNMDIFSRFDAIAVNLYPTFNQTGTYLPHEIMGIVKSTFHDTTGLPIYVAEFGVASEDSDNYDVQPYLTIQRWRKKSVSYEYQRGWAYRNLISTWANLPWVVGANWFSWFNQYGNPPGSDVRNSGLVDDNNNYYTQLTNQVRSVNESVTHIFRSPGFSLEDIQWQSVEIEICQ